MEYAYVIAFVDCGVACIKYCVGIPDSTPERNSR
jgi:hypothetical protein